MAEDAVISAISTLGSLLIQEIKLLGSAKTGVISIEKELESIRFFLKHADARVAAEEGDVLPWVKQLREEAYRIEDVIDQFSSTVAQLPDGKAFLGVLNKICRFVKKLKLQHELANEIQDIKSSMDEILQRAQSYYNFMGSIGQGSSSGTRDVIPHDSRVGSFFIEDSDVVGMESTINELIGWLTNESEQRSVLVLVGEEGVGKTTLAAKIYEKHELKIDFSCQAWITVGKEYNKKDLLRTIIQKFHCPADGEIDKMEENELISALRKHLEDLEEESYMVVFDDVWKIDFWEDVKDALQPLLHNKNNSKIMLTTHNKRVADLVPVSIVRVHLHEPLLSAEALQLFNKKAFAPDGCCHSELEELSKKIVEKCGRIPLAIVAVARLLSTKNNAVSEWQKLLDGLGSNLGNNHHLRSCNGVLSESYCDLRPDLKSCLLYFGLFPENYSVSCQTLMRLWIAEGFVQYSKHPSSEQVAEEYLAELIDRSLVQVVSRDISGRARSCKVHDLMYQFILRKTEELGFCRTLKEEDSNPDGKIRRISIHRSTDRVLENIKGSNIRAVLLHESDYLPKSLTTTLVADFKLIKVLDFRNSPIRYLPKGVGNLFHLHYLNARNTKVKVLPKSVGKLVNLETLDLKLSLVTKLPFEIKNLKKLRYLRVSNLHDVGRVIKLQRGFWKSTNLQKLMDLQKLYFVQADAEVLKELRKLRQLRKLGITLTNGNGKNLCDSIRNMKYLESLIVNSTSREEIIDIQSISSPQCLRRLCLMGTMNKLPDWILKHPSLIRVDLNLSGLREDPISVLQSLPNLLELRLKDTYHNEQLQFKEGWFPKLLELTLSHFEKLKLMIVDKGAMPYLRHLEIVSCPVLKFIPAEHLKDVKIENNDVSLLSSTEKSAMGQKIVLKVLMDCNKCRSKLMKICLKADGVISVALRGEDKDEVVVTGNEIDPIYLVTAIRKEVGYAEIVSVG